MATTPTDDQRSVEEIGAFLKRRRGTPKNPPSAVSLFSGAGLSDAGYELAGFRFVAQVEKDPERVAVGRSNFRHSTWIASSVREAADEVVQAVKEAGRALDLLVATPPCQGLSSSNPSRGKRKNGVARESEAKNALVMDLIPLARRLQPRVLIIENVRQILTLRLTRYGEPATVPELLRRELEEYRFFSGVVNVADYGVPQDRRRAVIVGVHKDEDWGKILQEEGLAPWPRPTHASIPSDDRKPWVTVRKWLEWRDYEPLNALDSPESQSDPLHYVPAYGPDRYALIRDIPRHSGRSAYENDRCPECGAKGVPEGVAYCPFCGGVMYNRPVVRDNGEYRLIRGFKSSYRRMRSDRPASTVTTNSSHVGSDHKVHPWEHRVLSIRECAELQTVPRFFEWSPAIDAGRKYLVRNLVGEALPPYFTFLHGRTIKDLLKGKRPDHRRLASG